MRFTLVRLTLGLALVGAVPASVLAAEEGTKALPTLLIKGEVVSLDTTNPAEALLKVKDRYGFETPIYLTPEAKIMQGDATVPSSSLTASTQVEVEYNFDINTAKRHAVSVKLAAPAAASVPAAPAAPAPAEAAAAPAAPVSEAPAPEAPAAPAASAPAQSSTPAPQGQQTPPTAK